MGFAATRGSVSVSQTGQAKTAVFTTHCPRPLPLGRLRDTKVPAVPTSSLAPSPGLSWSQPSSWAARAGDLKTSVVEGTTRPSRGQCDAGHVIPPAVLVSISSVPLHSVDRELGPIRFPKPCREPGKRVLCLLRPFLLPTRLLGPGPPSSVLSAAGSHGRVGAGTVPCNPFR